VALRFTALALQRGTREGSWTRAPDGETAFSDYDRRPSLGKLRVWGIGQASLSWRATWSNHVVEAGVKVPLLWWTNRSDNTMTGKDVEWFDGAAPTSLYLGYGY
jgi:hypothetical protein